MTGSGVTVLDDDARDLADLLQQAGELLQEAAGGLANEAEVAVVMGEDDEDLADAARRHEVLAEQAGAWARRLRAELLKATALPPANVVLKDVG
jgi:hypothetical protein